MKVSEAGRRLIEGFEGCRLTAYFDVVGVPTIGYGHTDGVRPGQVITQAQADQMLADDLGEVYGPGVLAAIGDAPTTQAQFDAMASLAFNIGVGAFKSSTVCRMHKAGNYTAAAEAFHLWNRAGQRVLEPLTRRRLAEAKLYLSKSPAAPSRQEDAAPPVSGGSTPIDDIRSAQRKLLAAGLLKKPSGAPATEEDIDGDPGDCTRDAARRWRAAHPA